MVGVIRRSASRRHRSLAALVAVPVTFAALADPVGAATTPTKTSKAVVLDGLTLFRANCGTCHTLAAAKTHGHIGPVLNWQSLSTATVTYLVTNGSSIMPGFRGTLATKQIASLAAFVAKASSA